MKPPWTRAHERFAKAWLALQAQQLRRGWHVSPDLSRWIERRWSVFNIRELTPAQARHGARQLNAWRGSER